MAAYKCSTIPGLHHFWHVVSQSAENLHAIKKRLEQVPLRMLPESQMEAYPGEGHMDAELTPVNSIEGRAGVRASNVVLCVNSKVENTQLRHYRKEPTEYVTAERPPSCVGEVPKGHHLLSVGRL